MNIFKSYPGMIGKIELLERCLQKNIRSRQPLITSASEELLHSGGKRIRPLFLLLWAMQGDYDEERMIPLACAVEILHMATLVHDDIIDESMLRRGVPTVQSKWGKDTAVFLGDFLFCRAFMMLSGASNQSSVKKLTRGIKRICEGEIGQYQQRYDANVSIYQYLKRISAKTAALFTASCYLGAVEAQCSRKIATAAAQFGHNLGMAFQITDDLLDFSGEKKIVGKPVNNDFVQGIYTLPVLYSLGHKGYGEKMRQYLIKPSLNPAEREEVLDIVTESGGIGYAKELTGRYLERAEKCLGILPSSEARAVMEDIVAQVVDRTS